MSCSVLHAVCLTILLLFAGESGSDANWPSFRGPCASGVSEGSALPAAWDVESMKNVRWKTPVPGLGHSSPVVWGNRVFVTTAVRNEGEASLKVGLYGDIKPVDKEGAFRWYLYCLDRTSGKVLWKKMACEGKPKVKRHTKSSHANPTPCTNGKVVVAFFGSEGLYGYDMDGGLLWKKDLGVLDAGFYRMPSAQWGGGSSPVIREERLYLQCDVQKQSFVAAYDVNTGKEIWKTSRKDVPTWGTPTVVLGSPEPSLCVNGYRQIAGYDLASGRELWCLTGGGDIPVPTPVEAFGLIFITNAHGRMAPVYAVKTAAKGDISLKEGESSNEHIAWSVTRGGNYMTTPIVYGEHLYLCSDRGMLTCYDARSGARVYSERLGKRGSAFTASPVAGDGKLYFTGEKGQVFVVKAGREYELLQVNEMTEVCMASPAIAGGTLFFRTRHHLVAVGVLP